MTARSQRVKQVRGILWHRQEGLCSKCGEYVEWADATLDHSYPQSKGGRTTLENGTMMCAKDNQSKGASVQ